MQQFSWASRFLGASNFVNNLFLNTVLYDDVTNIVSWRSFFLKLLTTETNYTIPSLKVKLRFTYFELVHLQIMQMTRFKLVSLLPLKFLWAFSCLFWKLDFKVFAMAKSSKLYNEILGMFLRASSVLSWYYLLPTFILKRMKQHF